MIRPYFSFLSNGWLYLFLVVGPLAFGQDTELVDSLNQVLQTAQVDTHKVILLNDIAWELKFDDPQKARAHLKEAVSLSQQLNYPKGEAQAYNINGVVESIQGNIDQATHFYQKALSIREALGDQKGVASMYNNIGNLMEEKGDFVAALDNLNRSLRIRRELKDTQRIARVLYNISYVHETMGNYPEALEHVLHYLELVQQLGDQENMLTAYNLLGNIKSELERFAEAQKHYEQALAIGLKLQDQWELADVYNNLGNLFDDLGKNNYKEERFAEALPQILQSINYHQQALAIHIQLEDKEGESSSYNNLGVVYKNFGSYYKDLDQRDSAEIYFQAALQLFDRSLTIREAMNNRKGIMEVFNGIGDVKRRQKKLDEALAFTQKYMDLAKALNDGKFIQKAYKDLSRVHADLDNYKLAFKFRKKYDELRYERLSEDRVKRNLRREAIYGDFQKQVAIEKQEKELLLNDIELQQATFLRNSLIGGTLALILLALLLYNRYRIKHKANISLEEKNKIIEQEKQRSENLLLNILPAETAAELKAHGQSKARKYDSVTVLFSDIKSFTQIAEQMSPEELVKELDVCFRAFDKITDQYGIEKIKTIGDAYMCAGGLPTPNKTHPHDVVKAALDMQQFMTQHQKDQQSKGKPPFEIRIGIHTGPVVAGIVGNNKFAYDIWGDTVNLASRMESGGAVGKVNISRATYELIKKDFDCQARGKFSVKNKGELEMYFAKQKKSRTHVQPKV
ncbi:MAG: adenylate/guanylate cyclase domain-containing protein [Bacteroidota bacterium]